MEEEVAAGVVAGAIVAAGAHITRRLTLLVDISILELSMVVDRTVYCIFTIFLQIIIPPLDITHLFII